VHAATQIITASIRRSGWCLYRAVFWLVTFDDCPASGQAFAAIFLRVAGPLARCSASRGSSAGLCGWWTVASLPRAGARPAAGALMPAGRGLRGRGPRRRAR
jgi:hypothetical protein